MKTSIESPFKVCSYCSQCWMNRKEFIVSPQVAIIGYQPDFGEPQKGLLLFNHLSLSCGTTMAIEAVDFIDLYHGPLHSELNKGKDGCSGYCLDISNLEPCEAKCAMNQIRALIQLLKSKSV